MHWSIGGVAGAGYGALLGSRGRRPWLGALYGLAVWAGFEAFGAPLLGIDDPRERPLRERLAVAADHVLYGVIIARP